MGVTAVYHSALRPINSNLPKLTRLLLLLLLTMDTGRFAFVFVSEPKIDFLPIGG